MKKGILVALATAAVMIFASCEDEEPIAVIDYGLKTFEADMQYLPDAAHGELAYTQQSYFNLGNNEAVDTATYGSSSWVDFNIYKASENYNVTTDVAGWDIVFTHYIDLVTMMGQTMEYGVTGILIDTMAVAGVAQVDYTESTNADSITTAFATLDLADVVDLKYSNDMGVIGYDWKTTDMQTHKITVNTNYFYVLKLVSGDTYKLRIVSFFGTTEDERIIKIEYQLMK